MKPTFLQHIKQLMVMIAGVGLFAACNKDVPDAKPITPDTSAANQTIAELLNDAGFSILKAAATKAGILEMLGDRTAVYTVFAPDDAAFQRSGITSAHIAAIPAEQLRAILQYHVVGGQRISSAMIPTTFPNLQLPSMLVLAPPSAQVPPGLRMSIFASKRGNFAWANNIPLTAVDIQAANGILHKTAAIVAPPQQLLWARITSDSELEYLKAAIQRADEGNPSPGLVAALSNPAASLTVFAPNDAAFQQILTAQIAGALIAQGVPPATAQAQAIALASTPGVFSNPLLGGVLTPTNVAGLVAYHILGSRAFSVNLPATATTTPTLLNRAVTNHPGVSVQATFGATGVTAATVKGVANPTASNIQINPTPAPNGTSDQHYVNGVLHVIDQVLRPQ